MQRFGSDLALNVHFHVLFLDGVYDGAGHFTPITAPSLEQMEELCTPIAERVQRLLLRRAIEHDEPEERALALSLSRSAARLGTTKYAPEGTDLEHDHDATWKRKARVDGFDLEATTEVRAEDRERLEHLCCYLLRPPLADRRLRLLPSGTVALELKSPWRDGTKWLSMSAHAFLERLCSLVPRPRTNQILYRGVLAPSSARREKVVPRARGVRPAQERDILRADEARPGARRARLPMRKAHALPGYDLRPQGAAAPAHRQGPTALYRAHPPGARTTAEQLRLRCVNDVHHPVREGRRAPAV